MGRSVEGDWLRNWHLQTVDRQKSEVELEGGAGVFLSGVHEHEGAGQGRVWLLAFGLDVC